MLTHTSYYPLPIVALSAIPLGFFFDRISSPPSPGHDNGLPLRFFFFFITHTESERFPFLLPAWAPYTNINRMCIRPAVKQL